MQFGKQNKFKKALYSKVTILVLLVLIVLLGRSVWERLRIERDMAGRAAQTEAALSELTQRKDDLQERVEYLEGERGIEEEIRKNFDVAKEGEQVIILMGEGVQEAEVEVGVQETALWYQFWR
tara:strand:- start:2910 stop:3278 length:369 start_codon:yes stop_codon:yes gene_type:complete